MNATLKYLVYGLILWAGMKTHWVEPTKTKPMSDIKVMSLERWN